MAAFDCDLPRRSAQPKNSKNNNESPRKNEAPEFLQRLVGDLSRSDGQGEIET